MTHHAIFTLPLVATLATLGGSYVIAKAPKAPPKAAIASEPRYVPEWDYAFQSFPRPVPSLTPVPVRIIRIQKPPLSEEIPLPRPRPEPSIMVPEPELEIEPEDPPKVGARPKQRRASIRYSRSAKRGDLCSRHNRRKVFVSRYKWRCLK